MKQKFFLFLIAGFFSISFSLNLYADEGDKSQKEELNIYSSRKEEFLTDLLKKFSEENDVKVNVKSDSDVYKLIESIKAIKSADLKDERINPDILITADVSSIDYAKKQNLLEKSDCKIYQNVDKFFLDGECYWSALSFRARVIAYSKERISADLLSKLTSYKALTEKDNNGKFIFAKKVLLTPFSSPYNQFLVAYLIELYGEDFANNWISDLINGVTYKRPSGNDTGKLEEIANGSGDIAIVNSYYFFRKLLAQNSINSNDDTSKINSEFASKVGIVFPNQDEKGTSVNFSAVGLVSDAPHKKVAEKFIEFLLSKEAQEIILKNNHEYSVTFPEANETLNQNVTDKTIIFDMKTNVVDVSKNVEKALDLASKNDWN